MLDDPLRGSGLLEENGCITTVPKWREVGYEKGWSISCSLVVREDEREGQTHTIQVLYYMYAMPLIRLTL